MREYPKSVPRPRPPTAVGNWTPPSQGHAFQITTLSERTANAAVTLTTVRGIALP